MGDINVLGFDVANLIAAGEVVDRPASVVKELVENSIDSGADTITVEIKNGGISQIKVTDNGKGIYKDDLPLVVLRHATSKIKRASDLETISTLGFRGEALAAISSVTKLRIYSRRDGCAAGSYLHCDGGEIIDLNDYSCKKGTTVITDELFYNVPARRKFLKRDATECAKITDLIEKIALSSPNISMKYVVDGQTRFMTQGDGNLLNAVHSVFGKATASRLIPVKRFENGITVSGYIGEPDMTFSKRSQEICFVNGRYIRSPLLMSAVERAYLSRIPSDKFPMCVINIEIAPGAVDVNVHPTKLEVKFSNERTVAEAVYYALLTSLNKTETRPEMKLGVVYGSEEYSYKAKEVRNAQNTVVKSEKDEKQLTLNDENSIYDVVSNSTKTSLSSIRNNSSRELVKKKEKPTFGGVSSILAGYEIPEYVKLKADNEDEKLFGDSCAPLEKSFDNGDSLSVDNDTVSVVPDDNKSDIPVNLTSNTINENDEIPSYKIIGEVYDCYVIIELEDRILLIDKHAAHERIIFDELCRRRREKVKESQMLLAPIEFSLTAEEKSVLGEYSEDMEAIGFGYIIKSETSVLLTKIPAEISISSAEDVFQTILLRLSEGQDGIESAEAEFFEKALYQASCKAAIKGGRHYGIEHIDWICKRLLKKADGDGKVIKTCPHGRPVAFEIKRSSIERQFSRID